MHCPSHISHIRGAMPGPTVVVLGGTHGDELTGIAAVQILAELLGVLREPFGTIMSPHPLVQGNLYLGYGNPEAILRRTRSASTGPDLNRSFLPTELNAGAQPSDRADLKRARELSVLLAQTDFLLDIHSVSSESEPFLCSTIEGPGHRAAVGLLPTPWFLSDPDFVLAQDLQYPDHGTTDSWVNRHGGVGLCYETGNDQRLDDALRVVPAILMTLTHKFKVLLPSEHRVQTRFHTTPLEVNTFGDPPPDDTKRFYKLTHCEIAAEREFVYAPEFKDGWSSVVADQMVGTYGTGVHARAPHDGMVVLQRSPDRIVVGQHLFFMAVPS